MAARRPRHRLAEGATYLPPILVVTCVVVAWELLVRVNNVPRGLLPPPSAVLASIVDDRGQLLDNLEVTLVEIVLGFVLGLATGIVVAIGIVYSKIFEYTIYPFIIVSQTIPIFALAPLLIIWLGFGIEPKVVIVAVGVFFPVAIDMVAGLREADQGMLALMRTYRASEWQTFRTVRLPGSVPFLIPGAQVGTTYAVIGAVIAEWIGAEKGIGKVMIQANAVLRTDLLFAAMVVITVVALALFLLIRLVGRVIAPWYADQ
jgi:ABC-type nitrate/sulfonate/bicarbonate transport system permease component